MRTRLSTAQRRAQLLELGAKLFAQRPSDDVSIEEVAELAGISNGLLYHYFPSKRAFFLAIVEDQSEKLLHASVPDPEMPPLAQLNAGLDIYIDYAARYPDGFRVAQSGAFSNADLHEIHHERVTAHRDRILTSLAAVMTIDRATQIAVTGWLAFVPTAILDWLDHPAISSGQLRDLCARALLAAVDLPTSTTE